MMNDEREIVRAYVRGTRSARDDNIVRKVARRRRDYEALNLLL
jgi:hypothetical protein